MFNVIFLQSPLHFQIYLKISISEKGQICTSLMIWNNYLPAYFPNDFTKRCEMVLYENVFILQAVTFLMGYLLFRKKQMVCDECKGFFTHLRFFVATFNRKKGRFHFKKRSKFTKNFRNKNKKQWFLVVLLYVNPTHHCCKEILCMLLPSLSSKLEIGSQNLCQHTVPKR